MPDHEREVDYERRSRKFEKLMAELIGIAEADGVITQEESEILTKIGISIKRFEEAVEEALEDDVITDREYLVLKNIEDDLLNKVFRFIEQDDNLDNDSKRLVEKIFDVLIHTL